MNSGKLIILLITIALGATSAAAQQDSVTFTDHSKQSITISRFGTVLNFKNSKGKETVPGNVYRVCPCGQKASCIESTSIPSDKTSSQLDVMFPKKGTTLKKGETLVVKATFRYEELTVRRSLKWTAGSTLFESEEVISGSKPLCSSTFEDEGLLRFEMKMCPRPPGAPLALYWTCPPEIDPSALQKAMTVTALRDLEK
ncbi:MAG TPA: hypothetical protein VF290_20690 [Pyrinomonadaceae bacterium]